MNIDKIQIIPKYVDDKLISLTIVAPEKNVCICKSHIGNTVEILIGNCILKKRILNRRIRHRIHMKHT